MGADSSGRLQWMLIAPFCTSDSYGEDSGVGDEVLAQERAHLSDSVSRQSSLLP